MATAESDGHPGESDDGETEGLVEYLARGIDLALRHLVAEDIVHARITLRGLLEHVEVPQERYVTSTYMNDLVARRVEQAERRMTEHVGSSVEQPEEKPCTT